MLNIRDFIDVVGLEALLSKYSKACSLPVSLYDDKSNVVFSILSQEICQKFHLADLDCKAGCEASTLELIGELKGKKQAVKKCVNGLLGLALSIEIDGIYYGAIVLSEFLYKDSIEDKPYYLSICQKYGFDENEYFSALDSVPKFSKTEIEDHITFFNYLIEMLCRQGMDKLELVRENKLRKEVQEKLDKANLELEQKAEEKIALVEDALNELRFEIEERTRVERELQILNVDLENRVKQRTFLLEKEIEFRKKLIKELEKSEGKYRLLVENAFDAIYLFEGSSYSYVNPRFCEMTKYSQEDILNKDFDFSKLICDKTEEMGAERFELRKKGEKNVGPYETQIIDKFGQIIDIEINSVSLESTGKFGVLGFIRDITERKKYEVELIAAKEKAEETAKLKTIILGNLGHELRTPLNGALGFASILKTELEDKNQIEIVDLIYSSMKRLEKTLNSLIELSEIESGYQDVNLTKANLCDVLNNLYCTLNDILVEKGLFFELQINDKDISINIDENLLNQIMFNILDNSVKFTEHGKVCIKLNKLCINDENFAEIRICDTGIGISPENLKTIFDPFRQVSEGLDRMYEGVGLGLTVTKKFVEILGGSITIKSEIGRGTDVILIFKAA